MDELDGDGAAHDVGRVVVRRSRGEEDEQRPQPLAAGGDRRAGVGGEDLAVPARQLGEAVLDVREQRRDARPCGLDDLADGLGGGGHVLGTVPTCRAMIPPAVRIHRTSVEPRAGEDRSEPLRAREPPHGAREVGVRLRVRGDLADEAGSRGRTTGRRTSTAAASSAS